MPPRTLQRRRRVGTEKIDGRDAAKFRLTQGGETAWAWFDPTTGAPVRMQSPQATLDWKGYEVGPQEDALFQVPKGYQVMDMDEMQSKMKAMGGAGGMGALGTLAGAGGMPGMGAGGVSGMAHRAGSNLGSQMGGEAGGAFGGTLGGPLGAIAGRYVGQKIGGWLGGKTADAVTPGPSTH